MIQSNYIPWKGYFDIIREVDLFIFYDDVQYTKNDWRNRNRIKTVNGARWLTIPVGGNLQRLICEVPLPNCGWEKKHWTSIRQAYAKAPYFKRYRSLIEGLYLGHGCESLSELNQHVTKTIAREVLGISTEFHDSRAYHLTGSKLARLIELVTKTGADTYVSGPTARDYIDSQCFAEEGIKLVYKSYSGYPEYPQRYPPFEHAVSIVDLIFNVGPEAPWYIWGWRSAIRQRSE